MHVPGAASKAAARLTTACAMPSHGAHVKHGNVQRLAVGGETGDLDRPIAEVAEPLVADMQVAVHEVGRPHGFGDALEPLPVGVVAGEVGPCPPGRRPRERVHHAGRAFVSDHHVGVAAGDHGRLLLVGDLFLRPPVQAFPAARLVEADTAAAGKPRAAVPGPAMTTRQVAQAGPQLDAAVRAGRTGGPGSLGELSEVLVVAVDEPQFRACPLQRGADRVEVMLSVGTRPDSEVSELEDQRRRLVRQQPRQALDHVQRPAGVPVPVSGDDDPLATSFPRLAGLAVVRHT